MSKRTPEEVLAAIRDDEVKMVDLRFVDLPGIWQPTLCGRAQTVHSFRLSERHSKF